MPLSRQPTFLWAFVDLCAPPQRPLGRMVGYKGAEGRLDGLRGTGGAGGRRGLQQSWRRSWSRRSWSCCWSWWWWTGGGGSGLGLGLGLLLGLGLGFGLGLGLAGGGLDGVGGVGWGAQA